MNQWIVSDPSTISTSIFKLWLDPQFLTDPANRIIDFTGIIDTQINDIETIEKILSIEVGFSFFQKDGIFNELISTGSFELIENRELKNTLLEIFNHLKERNIATSKEIDNFNIIFRGEINSNFRIRFTYNSFDGKFYGSRKLINSKFNKNYYLSNSFYGAISQAQQYVNMYSRLLRDLEDSYKTALSLSKEERNNFEE